MAPLSADTVQRLRNVIGEKHVVTDPDIIAGYVSDWTGRFRGSAPALVRPGSTAEVSEVMKILSAEHIPVTIYGGGTSLVGGAVPHDTVLLATARLTDLDAVDTVGRLVGVGAGVTLAALETHVAQAGLHVGLDLASKHSATIGGMASTNAGGVRVIRHGNTRAQVRGIEAVLADGSVLRRWSGLAKDNVGYDLPGLLVGSEGTLAIVTKVLLKLVAPQSAASAVAAVAVDSVTAALGLVQVAEAAGLAVEAAEIMTADGMDLVLQSAQPPRRPFSSTPTLVALLEVSGGAEIDQTMEALAEVVGERDAVVEPAPGQSLWALRERHTEAIAAASGTPVIKLDLSLPARSLDAAMVELRQIGARFGGRPILFGHFGDGNIHANFLDVDPVAADELTAAAFAAVTALQGSISAEHGIGIAKRAAVTLGRSAVDIALMREIKRAFDPAGLLNPGVLFVDSAPDAAGSPPDT